MAIVIKQVLTFECSDGKNFDMEEDAIRHEKINKLSEEIVEKFAAYGNIEDIGEVLRWLIEIELLRLEDFNG